MQKEIEERQGEIDQASQSVMETVRKWRMLTELNAISEEELNNEQKMGLNELKRVCFYIYVLLCEIMQ